MTARGGGCLAPLVRFELPNTTRQPIHFPWVCFHRNVQVNVWTENSIFSLMYLFGE